MDMRERIEQAIISAGAFTGEDTELLLNEISELYEKANARDKTTEVYQAQYEDDGITHDEVVNQIGLIKHNLEDKNND